jgi:hypothetical protein
MELASISTFFGKQMLSETNGICNMPAKPNKYPCIYENFAGNSTDLLGHLEISEIKICHILCVELENSKRIDAVTRNKIRGRVSKQVTNGSKTALMGVISFVYHWVAAQSSFMRV